MSKIIITGVAGFIGYSVAKRLLLQGHTVIGVDLNEAWLTFLGPAPHTKMHYLVKKRVAELNIFQHFQYIPIVLGGRPDIMDLNYIRGVDCILHFAGSAGISICETHPAYNFSNNISLFADILNVTKRLKVPKLIYASSSSVYSGSRLPKGQSYHEGYPIGNPSSVYGLSKLTMERMAEQRGFQSEGTDILGLRLFSVYGPYGRPDMAPWRFAASHAVNKLPFLTDPNISRDFTYIDDVVNIVEQLALYSKLPPVHSVVNVGYGQSRTIAELNTLVAKEFGTFDLQQQKYNLGDPRYMDAPVTQANTSKLMDIAGIVPTTSLDHGIKLFTEWYKQFKQEFINSQKG